MQIENFKIFADLVETKSFSKSAKLNGITQSAVSQQARAMERHFKTLLIDRSQKQFQLTREGQRVYESAKEILHTYDKLLSELQEMKKVISGTIRISTIYSIGLHELPPYIKKFLHDYPSVNVRVEYRRSNLVYEDILHNSVDFGLVAFPVKQRQIEAIAFRNDHLVLIAHPNHPLAKKGDIELKELAGQKFIGFDPDIPTRKAVDQIFRDYKLEIEPVMEFDNIETVKRAVEIDHGIAIVPMATVHQEIQQGTLSAIHFKGKDFTRPLAILHRKGRVLTPAMKKFIETLGLEGTKRRQPSPTFNDENNPETRAGALAGLDLRRARALRRAGDAGGGAGVDADRSRRPGRQRGAVQGQGRRRGLLGHMVRAVHRGDPRLHRAAGKIRGGRAGDRGRLAGPEGPGAREEVCGAKGHELRGGDGRRGDRGGLWRLRCDPDHIPHRPRTGASGKKRPGRRTRRFTSRRC
jgi:DNA-binding transcriptional LysR family regulator